MIKTQNIVAALGVLAGTGVLATPGIVQAASNTATADLSVTVGSFIELAVQSGDSITVNMDAGADRADAADKTVLKVNTNKGSGFKIEARDNVVANGGKLMNGSASIDPMADGGAAPSGKTGKWGLTTDGNQWYGITGVAKSIVNRSNLTNMTVDVNYGFSTTENQAAGTYTGTILFTASVNN